MNVAKTLCAMSISCGLFLAFAEQAHAAEDTKGGQVVYVRGQWMPNEVHFVVSGISCSLIPQHQDLGPNWLWFQSSDLQTNKAVFAIILAALHSQRGVMVTYDTVTCEVRAVHGG